MLALTQGTGARLCSQVLPAIVGCEGETATGNRWDVDFAEQVAGTLSPCSMWGRTISEDLFPHQKLEAGG